MSIAPSTQPTFQHDPTLWHLAPAPGVRQLHANPEHSTPALATMVYDGDLRTGHAIVPNATMASNEVTADTIAAATPAPQAEPRALEQHFRNALFDIFEGDLDAGNAAMQALEKHIKLTHHLQPLVATDDTSQATAQASLRSQD